MRITVATIAGKGRGVIALAAIAAGEVIERAPVLVIGAEDSDRIGATVLGDYWFDWRDGSSALVLGYGSLYNHSDTPNALYRRDFEARVIEFLARAPIAAGAEITISYNGDPADRTPIIFNADGSWTR